MRPEIPNKIDLATITPPKSRKQMRVLLLSHEPHKCHLAFAKSVNAKIKVMPIKWYAGLAQKLPLLGYFYPFVSLLYSLLIRVKRNILLVEGGSSLYVAAFLKMMNKRIKIVYMDVDLMFYNLTKRNLIIRKLQSVFFKKISM